jgi:hypothetical protein
MLSAMTNPTQTRGRTLRDRFDMPSMTMRVAPWFRRYPIVTITQSMPSRIGLGRSSSERSETTNGWVSIRRLVPRRLLDHRLASSLGRYSTTDSASFLGRYSTTDSASFLGRYSTVRIWVRTLAGACSSELGDTHQGCSSAGLEFKLT